MTAAEVEQFRTRQVLADYRRTRRHKDPFNAARHLRDGWARYLADAVVDGGETDSVEFASSCYRIARRIHDLACERAAVGVKKWDEMTPREQYWQRGRLEVAR